MKSKVIYSYLRHLVLIAYASALAYTKAKGVPITSFSKGELIWAGQAVWIAVLPQLRHAVEPGINLYLKKKYPALGIIVADLESAAKTPELPATPTI
jgi:hypothetical protein